MYHDAETAQLVTRQLMQKSINKHTQTKKHTRWKVNKFFLRLHCPIKVMESREWNAVDNNVAASHYLKTRITSQMTVQHT